MKMHAADPDIQTIVSRIENGDLDLQPDFQRGEVWSAAKKRRLIDSILRDWHVPPIHVVVEKNGRQVVLDGQQRLAAIRDFVNDELTVDGRCQPHDPAVRALDGLPYSALPTDIRRAFDQFTIRVFRLTDYSPEEPGELFYRLNQMTYLTAAEQRNAFFGPVREQIKDLVQQAESHQWSDVIGFSNRRMAYDDVLAKFLCTLEAGTLARRITAGEISDRFRARTPFSPQMVSVATDSISLMSDVLSASHQRPRFNKATLYSWLLFFYYFSNGGLKRSLDYRNLVHQLSHFCDWFEDRRMAISTGETEPSGLKSDSAYQAVLMLTYLDRSSSRVSDISSVVLRDVIIWLFFVISGGSSYANSILPKRKQSQLAKIANAVRRPDRSSPYVLEQVVDVNEWGDL